MEEFNERDLFAAFALNGLITKYGNSSEYIPMAYDMADAMLKEKEKRDDTVSRNKN